MHLYAYGVSTNDTEKRNLFKTLNDHKYDFSDMIDYAQDIGIEEKEDQCKNLLNLLQTNCIESNKNNNSFIITDKSKKHYFNCMTQKLQTFVNNIEADQLLNHYSIIQDIFSEMLDNKEYLYIYDFSENKLYTLDNFMRNSKLNQTYYILDIADIHR